MSILNVVSGLVGLYAIIILLGDKRRIDVISRGNMTSPSSSLISPGDPTTYDLGKGLHTTLIPDMGNGIPYVKEFVARDPEFTQRLRKATLERVRKIGVGKQYPYRTGNTIHDIGFPYMGSPLSYVAYPQGSNPASAGTWTPIEV